MKVDGVIPSLLNGVSQQTAPMRQVTQLERQKNGYSTILRGLKKRPPTERISEVAGDVGAFAHIINRDITERYVVTIANGSIRVFDFEGNEKTVTTPDGVGYISGLTEPESDLTAMTINDYTFIVNRKTVVAMNSSPAVATRPKEALINIVAGNYGRTYAVYVDGVKRAEYATPVGDNANQAPQIATTVIATELYNDLVATLGNTGAPWAIGIHTNAVHIVNYSNDFAIRIEDGVGGNAMKLAKGAVDKFSDLPQFGPHGYKIEVGGSAGNVSDNYWVWADKGGTDNNSKVTWREEPKPGVKLELNAATMPHVLIRNGDGTFTFKRATWAPRKCGDANSISPDPSFVGKTINDIFFHRNRLGFLSDDGVILSRAGEFFDFFRRTATALLDDDPIDVAAAHIKVSIVRAAVPIQDNLIIFSDQTQFRLAGNELLTAKTASIRPLTEFQGSAKVRPVAMGSMIFFASDSPGSKEWASIQEYTYDQQRSASFSSEVTAHVPAYIPSNISQLIGCVDEGVLVALTRNRRGSIFVYRYFWQDEEKVQSSWSEWTFRGASVLAGASIASDLYLVIRRGTKTYLEKIRLDTAATDDGLPFLVNLDGRHVINSGTKETYGGLTTTKLFPPDTQNIAYLSVVGAESGLEYRILERGVNFVRVVGEVKEPVFVGETYESEFVLSPIFYRQVQGQSVNVRRDGRLQLQSMTVAYDDSGYFRVSVDRRNRSSVSELRLLRLSPGINLDEPNVGSGTLNVPLLGRNEDLTIRIINDSWLPSNITGATWRGIFAPRNKENT